MYDLEPGRDPVSTLRNPGGLNAIANDACRRIRPGVGILKVAKLKGEFVWHAHEGQDELFYIVKGSLRIEFEDEAVDLEQGDFLTVPSGVRHNPVAREECWVLLIEPAATKHTGEEITSRTRSLEEQLG